MSGQFRTLTVPASAFVDRTEVNYVKFIWRPYATGAMAAGKNIFTGNGQAGALELNEAVLEAVETYGAGEVFIELDCRYSEYTNSVTGSKAALMEPPPESYGQRWDWGGAIWQGIRLGGDANWPVLEFADGNDYMSNCAHFYGHGLQLIYNGTSGSPFVNQAVNLTGQHVVCRNSNASAKPLFVSDGGFAWLMLDVPQGGLGASYYSQATLAAPIFGAINGGYAMCVGFRGFIEDNAFLIDSNPSSGMFVPLSDQVQLRHWPMGNAGDFAFPNADPTKIDIRHTGQNRRYKAAPHVDDGTLEIGLNACDPDAAGGTLNMALPKGFNLTSVVEVVQTTSGTVNITPDGALPDTINGGSSDSLTAIGETAEYKSLQDGSWWRF